SIVARLWVPCSHSLVARHLKRAASGVAVSASRAPSSAATFTPLSTGLVAEEAMVAVAVMVDLLWIEGWRSTAAARPGASLRYVSTPGPRENARRDRSGRGSAMGGRRR